MPIAEGFKLSIGPAMEEQLKVLLAAKIYGSSVAAVATTLIAHGIQKAVEFGIVNPRDINVAIGRAYDRSSEEAPTDLSTEKFRGPSPSVLRAAEAWLAAGEVEAQAEKVAQEARVIVDGREHFGHLTAFVCTCSKADVHLLKFPCSKCNGGEVLLQGRERSGEA